MLKSKVKQKLWALHWKQLMGYIAHPVCMATNVFAAFLGEFFQCRVGMYYVVPTRHIEAIHFSFGRIEFEKRKMREW